MTDKGFYGSKTVEKATTVLKMIAEHPEGLRNLELSKALGMDKSATHRILTSLRRTGFVRQTEGGGRFIIGDLLLDIAHQYQHQYRTNLPEVAEPFLTELVTRYRETASISALEGEWFRCVYKVEAPHELRFSPDYDRTYPLNAGATGKAILAHLDQKHAESILERRDWQRYTEATVTDSQVLLREIQEVRVRGFVASVGERVVGGCAMASPVFGRHGNVVGAVTLSAATARTDPDDLLATGPVVRASALAISRQLGFERTRSERRTSRGDQRA